MRANRVVFFVLTVTMLYAGGARPGEAAQAAPSPQVLATITVPVRLTGLLPEVTGGVVVCFVHGPGGPNQRVGIGTTSYSVDSSTGSFSQNVVVTVTANPGADLSLATNYYCDLTITGGNVNGTPGFGTTGPATHRAKPGTTLTTRQSGALPQ
jgi:hypothetical protein